MGHQLGRDEIKALSMRPKSKYYVSRQRRDKCIENWVARPFRLDVKRKMADPQEKNHGSQSQNHKIELQDQDEIKKLQIWSRACLGMRHGLETL